MIAKVLAGKTASISLARGGSRGRPPDRPRLADRPPRPPPRDGRGRCGRGDAVRGGRRRLGRGHEAGVGPEGWREAQRDYYDRCREQVASLLEEPGWRLTDDEPLVVPAATDRARAGAGVGRGPRPRPGRPAAPPGAGAGGGLWKGPTPPAGAAAAPGGRAGAANAPVILTYSPYNRSRRARRRTCQRRLGQRYLPEGLRPRGRRRARHAQLQRLLGLRRAEGAAVRRRPRQLPRRAAVVERQGRDDRRLLRRHDREHGRRARRRRARARGDRPDRRRSPAGTATPTRTASATSATPSARPTRASTRRSRSTSASPAPRRATRTDPPRRCRDRTNPCDAVEHTEKGYDRAARLRRLLARARLPQGRRASALGARRARLAGLQRQAGGGRRPLRGAAATHRGVGGAVQAPLPLPGLPPVAGGRRLRRAARRVLRHRCAGRARPEPRPATSRTSAAPAGFRAEPLAAGRRHASGSRSAADGRRDARRRPRAPRLVHRPRHHHRGGRAARRRRGRLARLPRRRSPPTRIAGTPRLRSPSRPTRTTATSRPSRRHRARRPAERSRAASSTCATATGSRRRGAPGGPVPTVTFSPRTTRSRRGTGSG